MKKIMVVLALIFALSGATLLYGCGEDVSPLFEFQIVDGEAYLIGYNTSNDSAAGTEDETATAMDLKIPMRYSGCPVVGIGKPNRTSGVEFNCKLRSIELPSTIRYIGMSAFATQPELEEIKFSPKDPEALEIWANAFADTKFLETERKKAQAEGRGYVLFHGILIDLFDYPDTMQEELVLQNTPNDSGADNVIVCKGIGPRVLGAIPLHTATIAK